MVLVVRVGESFRGIPIELVVETLRPLPIVDGRAIIRGESLRVVTLGAGERFVVVRQPTCSIALHVDGVLGARHESTVVEMIEVAGL